MKKIAIVSLLKPVDDPRHYHKIAVSLAKPNKYAINIIANDLKKKLPANDIVFHYTEGKYPLSKFSLGYHLFVVRKLRAIQPDLVIINHPVLLITIVILKLQQRFKLIYDVQENYKLNLLHQEIYSAWKAFIYAYGTRIVENVFASMVNHFLLAEAIYARQLPFVKDKFSIIENKSLSWSDTKNRPAEIKNLIFSGNISHISGVMRAISLYEKLQTQQENLTLTIIGHCPDLKLLKTLESFSLKNPGIQLKASATPIHYELVKDALLTADIGFICYKDNPSNVGKLPTKYFEYNALGLPYIVFKGTSWADLKASMAIAIDEQKPDINVIHQAITNMRFDYDRSSYLWQSEEQKLYRMVDQIL